MAERHRNEIHDNAKKKLEIKTKNLNKKLNKKDKILLVKVFIMYESE